MSGRRWLPNTTQMPNHFLDFIMQDLTESELKVALYILRRTYGFQKEGDRIALSQLVDGITKRDGTPLDRGTGLARSSVVRGVKGLEARGLLHVHRTPGTKQNAPETTFYTLAIDTLDAVAEGGPKLQPPQLQIATEGSPKSGSGVVPDCDQQNPVEQNQVYQESDEQWAWRYARDRGLTRREARILAYAHTAGQTLNRATFLAALPPRPR